MVNRRAAGSMGCMSVLAITAIALWVGLPAAHVYMRAYQYEDILRGELQFATVDPDSAMLRKIRAAADSIDGLPAEAYDIVIDRRNRTITIEGGYEDTIHFPLGRKKAVRHDVRIERSQ